MWNITLNEPIKKFNESGSSYYKSGNSNNKKKDSFCWKYNKNNCTYGKNCKFDHKCSYCGVSGHPVTNCHKKQGKRGDNKNKSNGSHKGPIIIFIKGGKFPVKLSSSLSVQHYCFLFAISIKSINYK